VEVVAVDEHPLLRPEAVPEERPVERLLQRSAPGIDAAARGEERAGEGLLALPGKPDLAFERQLRLHIERT